MLYLVLAICSSALVSIGMRLSERHVRNNMVMFSANYAVCTAIALLYGGGTRVLGSGEGAGIAAGLGAVTGFLYLAAFVLLQKNVARNGVILSGTAMKLGGVLIPVLTAMALFGERLGMPQLIGTLWAVVAIVLINSEKGEEPGAGTQKQWLALLLLTSGVADAMANIYDKTGPAALKNLYLVGTFFVALLVAVALALYKRQRVTRADLLCGLLIGIPNYFSARFLLLSLESVPAAVAYPVFSVGTIVVISAVGVAFFHERLNARKRLALGLILVALVLLNL